MPSDLSTPVIVKEDEDGTFICVKNDELEAGFSVSELHASAMSNSIYTKTLRSLDSLLLIAKEDHHKFMQEVRRVQASVLSA
jgi:hypothetical protein